ncbi:MAG: response regulator [Desulfuromonadales bacterium]|nr:response regulator [Desulfuromonadales bacterium]
MTVKYSSIQGAEKEHLFMREKLLIVDDEHMILELTSMVLRSKGFDVSVVDNASDSYELIEREQPAVVLLDYMMPKVNGLDALKEIRERFPETYVIMFTGKGSEEVAVELMKSGASDYILKPFSNAKLVERIENVLRLRSIELRNKELVDEQQRLLDEIERWNRELEERVEHKTAELERAHHEILMTEKLAALGHLSAGMAHEIRNPLNSISLFAQILQSGLENEPEMKTYSEKIINEVERIDAILVKLLSTSKRSPFQLRTIHINDVIEKSLQPFLEQIQAQGVTLHKQLFNKTPSILADADELGQVFSNLFSNALFEMKQGGTLSVSLTHDDRDALVTVADTGGGIPEDHLNEIFDPFFTTKERGTGFGLSVVLRIVKTYAGRINVQSEQGRGTTFQIWLPLA